MSYRDRISQDPKTCGGKPVVKGTRVPVSVILSHLANEDSVETILEAFPSITEADIRAVVAFAAAHVKDEDGDEPRRQPVIGTAKGLVNVRPTFFEPISEEELEGWEKGKITG